MEGENKRKRTAENGQVNCISEGEKEERELEGEKPEAAPTEEEVDEFFAILRRMHVAVKYFEKGNTGNGNGDGRKLTEMLATEIDDVQMNDKNVDGGSVNGLLDLNAVPEDESNSV
ncbi:unnamed protein product [Ilex paraguariensis]|uniref:Protein NIM1-INTERACTING 2-like n=1 Tax=Ilex paraguariensis TaxID=185542 RepID=A0ABC8UZU8_9AQUA